MDLETRLNRRHWLIKNIAYLLAESEYHKKHRDNFKNPSFKLWGIKDNDGRIHIQ